MLLYIKRLIKLLVRSDLTYKQKKWIMLDVYYDYLVILDKIKFETHLVLIAGLPKSGTTWLEQLLGSTPGLVQLNKSFIRTYPSGHSINLKHSHYVHPDMLNCAPK